MEGRGWGVDIVLNTLKIHQRRADLRTVNEVPFALLCRERNRRIKLKDLSNVHVSEERAQCQGHATVPP
eukprot:scaffold7349_cov284-Alexandrium_tamarense.AAC.7